MKPKKKRKTKKDYDREHILFDIRRTLDSAEHTDEWKLKYIAYLMRDS